MCTYCYATADGEVVERVYPMGQAPKRIKLESGSVAFRSYAAERVGVPATKGWPMTCFASGVNANQADELRQHLKECGVPTEITRDGDPVYTSATHRRRALKARGFFDRNSFN